jgi:hypothetical protein
MSYKGESPAKKVARLILWQDINSMLGPKFRSGILLSLLSPEAGDVSVQLGLGVPADYILGVDRDKHAAAAAQYKFQDVRCLNTDVAAAATRYKGRIVAAHLDFCSCMTSETLNKVAQVESCLAKGGVISCAFMAAREKGEIRDKIIGALNPRCANEHFGARATVLAQEIARRAATSKIIKPHKFIYYTSDTPGKQGMPIIIYLGFRQNVSAPSAGKKRKKVNAMLRHASYQTVSTSSKDLAATGVKLAKRYGRAEAQLLLNVRRQTIAAWKAHFTMGTYEE